MLLGKIDRRLDQLQRHELVAPLLETANDIRYETTLDALISYRWSMKLVLEISIDKRIARIAIIFFMTMMLWSATGG